MEEAKAPCINNNAQIKSQFFNSAFRANPAEIGRRLARPSATCNKGTFNPPSFHHQSPLIKQDPAHRSFAATRPALNVTNCA